MWSFLAQSFALLRGQTAGEGANGAGPGTGQRKQGKGKGSTEAASASWTGNIVRLLTAGISTKVFWLIPCIFSPGGA